MIPTGMAGEPKRILICGKVAGDGRNFKGEPPIMAGFTSLCSGEAYENADDRSVTGGPPPRRGVEGRRGRLYPTITSPASTFIDWPVMVRASSEARNSANRATSSGLLARFSGRCAISLSIISCSLMACSAATRRT